VSDGPPAADVGPAPVRVFNRSDRVWVFGFVRMAPVLILFCGLGALLLFHHHVGRLPDAVAIPLVLACLVVPFVLDRLPSLNPVNYVWVAADLHVTRLAGRPRRYPPDRVLRVELAPREGEEYDDRKPSRSGMDVTIRIRRAWPVRLLASPGDAQLLAEWARRHGTPVAESGR
jgi:hypothetical protein